MANTKPISVTHINIRLSISLMLMKLLFLEIISGVVVIFFHSSFVFIEGQTFGSVDFRLFQLPLFIPLVIFKIMLTFFVIIQWLNEYYEITSNAIVHRCGIIFRKEQKYQLDHISLVGVDQNIFGRALNYGTISLFDVRRNKFEDMYMIHNPVRYAKIIEELLPGVDERREYIRGGLPEEKFNGNGKKLYVVT